MEFTQAYQEIMESTKDLALATSVDGAPNVRIMNYIWCDQCKKVFFCTFKGSAKTAELTQNEKVAFTTIPVGTTAFVRVLHATAKISDTPLADMQAVFVWKYPDYSQMFAMGLDKFEMYEINFAEAGVSRDFGDYGTITL